MIGMLLTLLIASVLLIIVLLRLLRQKQAELNDLTRFY